MNSLKVAFGSISLFMSIFILPGCDDTDTQQEALDALYSGNYDRAIEVFRSCVDTEGDTGESASWCSFMLGKAYFDKGQYPEAITYLKRTIDVYKKDMWVFKLNYAWHFWLGRAYFENKQYKEAIVYFDKASSIAPQNPESLISPEYIGMRKYYLPLIPPKSGCYFWLGNAYYLNAQYQQSVNALKKAIELKPTAIDFYTTLAGAYRQLKQYDDAIAAVKRSIEIKPNDYAYGVLASIYRAKKQYGEAVIARKKAIELNPKNAYLYFRLAETYEAEENYPEAVNSYRKGLTITPDDINGIFPLANVYMAMGQFQEAINTLNQVVSLMTITGVGLDISTEEGYPAVRSVMDSGPAQRADVRVGDKIIRIDGKSAKDLSNKKAAENMRGTAGTSVVLTISRKGSNTPLEKTITREKFLVKGAAAPLAQRSFAERALGKPAASQEDAEKAYSIDREDPWGLAQSAMSVAYMDKGRYAEALSILSKMKDSPFARMLEATAYAKLGDIKKAIEIYTSIPDDYLASKSVLRQSYKKALLESLRPYVNARKEAAKSFEAKGQYREALKEYSEILMVSDENDAKDIMGRVAFIIKANPRFAELPEEARRHVMRAEVSTKEGKFEDAIREYKEAAKVAPFFPALYKAVALNCAELKLYRQAINNLKTYLALSPDAPDARTARDEIYKWEFMMEKGGK